MSSKGRDKVMRLGQATSLFGTHWNQKKLPEFCVLIACQVYCIMFLLQTPL